MENQVAYIALGSNQGDRPTLILRALMLLDDPPRVQVALVSQFMETQPVGGPPDQVQYLNAVAELRCVLSAQQLLERLQAVERQLGRVRTIKWGPRTIDLDLLLFGAEVIDEPDLKVPHPLMHERVFVLSGMVQIAPAVVHPVLGRTMQQIFAGLVG